MISKGHRDRLARMPAKFRTECISALVVDRKTPLESARPRVTGRVGKALTESVLPNGVGIVMLDGRKEM